MGCGCEKNMPKIAVVAIGGNSLLKDEKHCSASDQFEAIHRTCASIADLVEHGWQIAVAHGNGPQVGFALLRSELTSHMLPLTPIDWCVAETQGSIGYMMQQCLQNELKRRGINEEAVTLITQVLVDKADPAFRNPSKPIGSFYQETEARKIAQKRNWNIIEDAGRGWRRVVPSPKPLRVIESLARSLIEKGFIVIMTGGGGIPVVGEGNELRGIEAVIDKDYTSALLAIEIKADLLIILTIIEKVALNFGKKNQTSLDVVTLEEAKRYYQEGHFPPGSMGPKIQAVINFLEARKKKALITNLESLNEALRGKTGTWFVP